MEFRFGRASLSRNPEDLNVLRNYMDSGQWLSDFEADEAGLLPPRLKRGVLSEDGLYNLLQEI